MTLTPTVSCSTLSRVTLSLWVDDGSGLRDGDVQRNMSSWWSRLYVARSLRSHGARPVCQVRLRKFGMPGGCSRSDRCHLLRQATLPNHRSRSCFRPEEALSGWSETLPGDNVYLRCRCVYNNNSICSLMSYIAVLYM